MWEAHQEANCEASILQSLTTSQDLSVFLQGLYSQLQHPHLVWENLGNIMGVTPDSGFFLMYTLGGSRNGSRGSGVALPPRWELWEFPAPCFGSTQYLPLRALGI